MAKIHRVTQVKLNRFVEEKCPYDHWLTNKAYFSAIAATNASHELLPTRWRQRTKVHHCRPMYTVLIRSVGTSSLMLYWPEMLDIVYFVTRSATRLLPASGPCFILLVRRLLARMRRRSVDMNRNVRRILVGGSMPLAAWGEENFENLTTKWCILKYIWINMWSA